MAVLNEKQRRKLEKTVEHARDVAEPGARAAIEQLAVDRGDPYDHLKPRERELRNRLRARARQLGDKRDARTGAHRIDHLVVECAYEHWHRMLFARFLAENQVLMHPDGVAVTLQECEELAPDEGAEDGWELAARYAAGMLPQIFRPGSPVFELKLPPEKSRQLERLLAELPAEVFTASDSLGWVYQFWQAKKKDEVNRSEVKIGADELPAVTQLFTEPYMVQFLLHNTLGAWWVGRHGRDSLPVEMPYLRFLDDGTPAAGTFDGWPKTVGELKVLDPCCGSGHFLVAAFEILVRFRMAEEKLSPAEACDTVLRDNLHGLEIDERCTQIAAFALALAAWTFEGDSGYRVLPEMQIACSGLAPRAKKSEWLALAGDDQRLRNGMERLYELFQDAPTLGSLLDPTTVGVSGRQHELGVARFEQLRPLLDVELEGEATQQDAQRHELGVAAKGIIAATELLGTRFTLVATNVPYLLRRKQCGTLAHFAATHASDAKNDLATVFVRRALVSTEVGGSCALVSPQGWLHKTTYRKLRERVLRQSKIALVAGLGRSAFRDMNWWATNTLLLVLSNSTAQPGHAFPALDLGEHRNTEEKPELIRTSGLQPYSQRDQLANPDARIVIGPRSSLELLSNFADSSWGVSPADLGRFGLRFWELPKLGPPWRKWQSTVRMVTECGGRELLLRWDEGLQAAVAAGKAYIRGSFAWGRRGVVVSAMSHLPCTLYTGEAFDANVAVIVPREDDLAPALWCYCKSQEFAEEVRQLDMAVKVTSATFVKVPFDESRWQAVAAEEYPDGLPEPFSEVPTQWVFRGGVHPSAEPLQVAAARLLGYRWPDQADDSLDDLIDDDGIVCLPPVRGEQPAATRLGRVLARAFGDDWSAHKQAALLSAAGCKGWTLDRWLQDRLFAQHCKLFQQRPFIWHIWDGIKKGGFSALVNYHKLDRKLLETLTYNYLGDWIRRQQDGVKRAEDGAEDRLLAAQALETKLENILEGEPPCDIFVRWKPIEEQPMGWNPDINDGVRMNIRPFMLAGDVGKKGAGVLRDRPNIKWNKDRGRDPSDAPWYHLGLEYGGKDGDRINDHHLTLAEKQAAQDAAGGRT